MARNILLAASVAAALVSPVPAVADSASTFKLEVRGDDGEHVKLELAAGWLSALLRHSTIECDGSDDRRTHRMAEALDRRGEGAVYEFESRNGDRVVSRRSRGRLILETFEDDGDRAVVEMPWVLAECWLLGREPAGGLARWMADEGVSLRIDGRDGRGRVRIAFD
jgi:hypothetical protein